MRIADGKVLIYRTIWKPGDESMTLELQIEEKDLVTCRGCEYARHDATCGENEYLCSLWLESEDQDWSVPADGYCHNGVARKYEALCDDDCEHCDYATCPKEEDDEGQKKPVFEIMRDCISDAVRQCFGSKREKEESDES